uniref:Receptor for retinol uptake STRA6 n=1 Tax=Knipowitschia caucasica TaxID=637954 RepID=A0AAV2LUP6_KNICA
MNGSAQQSEPFDYSYYEYPDWYSNNAEPTKPPKEVILPCDPAADDQIFHIVIFSISMVVLLLLAALSRKNKLCQGFTRGTSSIFSLVNFLDQTQEKSLVLAVFGLVFSKLAMILIAPDPLPFYKDTPPHFKEFLKIVSIFYYPLLYGPLLVSSTLQLRTGYLLGALLSFSHGAVLLWQKIDCPKTPELYKLYALLASLPQLLCLLFICVRFVLLFIKGPEHDQDLDSSYYSGYVKELLKKKASGSSMVCDKPSLMQRIQDVPKSYIYVPEKVFRLPLKLAIGAFVSFICIYHTALLLIVLVVPTLHIIRAGIDENMFYLMMGFGIVLSEDRQETVQILIFYTWLLEGRDPLGPSDRDFDRIARHITRFDPRPGIPTNTRSYLRVVEFHADRIPHASQDDKIFLIRLTSNGEVNDFIERQPKAIKHDYNELCKAILAEYSDYGASGTLTAAMAVKQAHNELAECYYHRLRQAFFGNRNYEGMEEDLSPVVLWVLVSCSGPVVVFRPAVRPLSFRAFSLVVGVAFAGWDCVLLFRRRPLFFRGYRWRFFSCFRVSLLLFSLVCFVRAFCLFVWRSSGLFWRRLFVLVSRGGAVVPCGSWLGRGFFLLPAFVFFLCRALPLSFAVFVRLLAAVFHLGVFFGGWWCCGCFGVVCSVLGCFVRASSCFPVPFPFFFCFAALLVG